MDIEVETHEYGNISVYKWVYAPRNREVYTYIDWISDTQEY